MQRTLAIAATMATLFLAGDAQASNLWTMPLVPEPDGTLVCEAVNASMQERDVTLWLFDDAGVLVNFSECPGLLPMTVCTVSSTDDNARSCKIIVKGAKGNVRGSLMARSATNVTTAAVPAE